ncbi:hypothetical protein [Methanoregula sp.]|uniref:hypothetical protein n=1 Tax=Methanoregula sp. TaxID=2052170 RepID=UPI003D0C7A16
MTHDEPDAFSSLSDTEFSSGTTILKRSELFKDWTTAGEQTIDSESTERAGAEIQKTSDSEEDSDTQEEDGSPVAAESSGLPAERPESSAEHTSAESQKEVSDLMPGTQTSSRTSFADTVLVAAKSLISDQDAKIPRDEPVVSTPAYVASPGGRNPELSEDDASIKSDGDELQPEIILSPSQKIPEFAAVPQEMVTPTRTRTRKGEDRGALIEIVGGETGVTIPGEPAEPKPAVHDGVHIPHPVKPPFKKLLGTVAVLVVIAVILIVGGAFFLSTFSSGSTSNLHTQETSPVVTVQVTPTITPLTIPPSGIWIRIVYPGTFIGTVGNPGYLYQVSGSGDKFYKTLRSDGFIQATVRKLDYSGDTLTVEVYVNGSMIAHQAVAKPMGEINLLIDAKGNLPGIPPTSIATSRTPAGSNRLVYI